MSNVISRGSLNRSWQASARVADVERGAVLNAASMAGLLLSMTDNPRRALLSCPVGTAYWAQVREYLIRVVEDEPRSDRPFLARGAR